MAGKKKARERVIVDKEYFELLEERSSLLEDLLGGQEDAFKRFAALEKRHNKMPSGVEDGWPYDEPKPEKKK